ncbi:MAG TPA: NAD-dependent epimerase/dehydratase family protein [Chthoniobacterales bacterium]|nr:NAD-dependent epimerase/dehydratase family protein [Chthoniobacterales bacterium]
MGRILIAGCGYVGEATADLFCERGWQVEGWTASAESSHRLSEKPYGVRAVDIGDASAVSAAGGAFDVVVHCASTSGGDAEQYRRVYLEGTRNLIRAFPQAKFLFTSSTSVYAQKGGVIVDEESPAEPLHEKGKLLRETEELVLARGGIVARLGGIHGPGRSFFLTRFLAGEAVLDADGGRVINQVHRGDIAAALVLLAQRGEAGIFNLVGDEQITAREAYEWLSARLGKPLPAPATRSEARKRGASNKRVSNKKLRALGWVPKYPTFEIAMEKSILRSFGF